jgi:hypothetical protein
MLFNLTWTTKYIVAINMVSSPLEHRSQSINLILYPATLNFAHKNNLRIPCSTYSKHQLCP